MAAVGLPVWATGVWASTVWAAGVWESEAASTYTGNFVPIYLATTNVQNRVPVEVVASNNPNGAVPCRIIADTRAAVPVVVTADKANGLMPIFLV